MPTSANHRDLIIDRDERLYFVKEPLSVAVLLDDGSLLEGEVFLLPQVRAQEVAQRLVRLLDDGDPFFPLRRADDLVLVSRAHTVCALLADDGLRPRLPVGAGLAIDVALAVPSPGCVLNAEIPLGGPVTRFSDTVNGWPRFVALQLQHGLAVVAREHVRSVSESPAGRASEQAQSSPEKLPKGPRARRGRSPRTKKSHV